MPVASDDGHGAGAGRFEPDQHARQRALARAAFSDHGQSLALLQGKSDVADRMDLVAAPTKQAAAAAKSLADVLEGRGTFAHVSASVPASDANRLRTPSRKARPLPGWGTQAMRRLV